MSAKPKTLLVGLDAACWSYLNPLLQAGRLPTLQRLLQESTWGTLQSTMPAWTPTAWASIVTGKNPGKHGVFDMIWRRPGGYDFMPTSGQMRVGTPFWKHLNDHGLKVGLVNIPFTYPLPSIDGFVVVGFGAPNSISDLAYPPEAVDLIREMTPSFEPNVDPDLLRLGSPEQVFTAERHHQEQQVTIALALAEKYDVDVLVINLMLLDHANHKMPQMARVEDAICECDADIARLIAGFQPDDVMLISDHGSSRVKGHFLLNAWLNDHGYQVQQPRPREEQSGALNWLLTAWLRAKGWSDLSEKMIRRLLSRMVPRLNGPIPDRFWQMIAQDMPFAQHYVTLSEEINFARSKLFPGSIYSGLLYLNVVGRDETGVLSEQERAVFVAELKEKLAQIVEPDTGKPLFAAIYTADELYDGPMTPYAPDVIIDVFGLNWNIQMSRYPPDVQVVGHQYFVVGHQQDYGWHSRDGVFIFSGPDFKCGEANTEGHIMDLGTTLLHLYQIPIPEDYDGRVLTELLTAEFMAQHPVRHQDGDDAVTVTFEHLYSEGETQEINAHLRALGYIE